MIPAAHDPRLANFFRWMFFAAGPVEASVTAKSMGWNVPADRKGTVGFGSHEEVLGALELAVKPGPFICGNSFSAVDVYLGSHLIWGMQFGGIEKRPAFIEYVTRLTSRSAYVRAQQINDAKLAAK